MALVKWNKDVTISTGSEQDQELMMGILKLDLRGREQWKGKVIEKKSKPAFVELRKTFELSNSSYSNMLVIVANKGYERDGGFSENFISTHKVNVRISSNGSCAMSFDDMNEMNLAILEAQNVLENKNGNV